MIKPLFFVISFLSAGWLAHADSHLPARFDVECSGALKFTASISISDVEIRILGGREGVPSSAADLPVGYTALVPRVYNEVFSEALYEGTSGDRSIQLSFQKEDFDWGLSFDANFGFTKPGESGFHGFSVKCARR